MVVGPWSSRHDHCWWHSVMPLFMMTHLSWWQHIYAILCQFMTRFYQMLNLETSQIRLILFRAAGASSPSLWWQLLLLSPLQARVWVAECHPLGPWSRSPPGRADTPCVSVALPHVTVSQARKLTLDRTTLNVLCGAWSVFSVLFDSLLWWLLFDKTGWPDPEDEIYSVSQRGLIV